MLNNLGEVPKKLQGIKSVFDEENNKRSEAKLGVVIELAELQLHDYLFIVAYTEPGYSITTIQNEDN